MKKTIMIPLMGIAALGFVGCTDVAVPEYNAPSNPAPTQFQNQGQMVSYCKGTIASQANTKPMYVQMGRLVVEQGARPASSVQGTVDGKKYTCQFDTEGKYVDTYAN